MRVKQQTLVLTAAGFDNNPLPVVMRLGETPVPIPNTTVKTQAADGPALETMWESRWTPDQKENNRRKSAEYKYRHWKVSPVGNRVEPEKNR